jgi:hypothetical protein
MIGLPLVVAMLSPLLMLSACASAGSRPPDVATAQVGTAILKAATELQLQVNNLTAAGTLPVPAGQKITDANKLVSERAGQLSSALKAYHAATTLTERSNLAAKVQALITQLSEPLSQMLGVELPAGAAQSISRLIGVVMQAVGAVQAEVAKGLTGRLWRPQLPALA